MRVRALDLQALALDSGSRCCESLAKWSLHMSSPKTLRICAPEDWTSSSKGLPAWGMMSLGVCWALGTSVRRIDETECGSLLPTPTGAGNEHAPSMQKWPAHRALKAILPTPISSDWKGGNRLQAHNGPRLCSKLAAERGYLPTPLHSDADKGGRGDLLQAVRGNSNPHFKTRTDIRVGTGGVFIALREWMMGWPLGWSASEPLATDRFQQWLRSHGVPSRPSSTPRSCYDKSNRRFPWEDTGWSPD